MGTRMTWEQAMDRLALELMRAPLGSEQEKLAEQRLRAMADYAMDEMMMVRLRTGEVTP